MAEVIFYKNDMLVWLKGMKNPLTDEFINDATCTAVVKDKYGANVGGQTWPVDLNYVAASNGEYVGILDAGIALNVGDRGTVEVTIDVAGGIDGFFKAPFQVRQRGKDQ